MVFLAYYPASHNGFVNYDDLTYVVENSRVQAGLDLGRNSLGISNLDRQQLASHHLAFPHAGLPVLRSEAVWTSPHEPVIAYPQLLAVIPDPEADDRHRVAEFFGWPCCLAYTRCTFNLVAWVAERKDVLSGLFGFACPLVLCGVCAKINGRNPWSRRRKPKSQK